MRDLKNFTVKEWLQLLPLSYAFKLTRNDIWLERFKNKKTKGLDAFLCETASLADRNIALIVAFEQPWALEWLLRMASRNVADTSFLVFDNSRTDKFRQEIAQVCKRQKVPYLGLPVNRTRHVNRSHGNAMTWIFHNVVRQIKPRMFAFIDHDMVPVKPLSFTERLGAQPVYGFRRPSKIDDSWNLWAGYSLFDFHLVKNQEMNFLYDFSRGLDTGGRNWDSLYSTIDYRPLRFANNYSVRVIDPETGEPNSVQMIDDCWLHIGGISYNDNFKAKSRFCANLATALDQGTSWLQLCGGSEIISHHEKP